MDVGQDLDPKRPSSVYYAQDEHKAHGVKWPVPKGGPGAFFTTWNAMAAMLITALALLTIPWMRIWPSTQKVASFTIVPLAIAIMASIIVTTILSQMMLAFNVEIERSDKEGPDKKDAKLALSVNFVKKMLEYNFIYHLGPLVMAVILGLAITFIPGPSTIMGKGAVFLVSFLYFVTFVLAWFLTPVDVQKHKDEEPETVIGMEKINHVYRNPPSWYFTILLPLLVVLVLTVCVFALYGSSTATGFKGF